MSEPDLAGFLKGISPGTRPGQASRTGTSIPVEFTTDGTGTRTIRCTCVDRCCVAWTGGVWPSAGGEASARLRDRVHRYRWFVGGIIRRRRILRRGILISGDLAQIGRDRVPDPLEVTRGLLSHHSVL